jgi:ribosomal protein S27E
MPIDFQCPGCERKFSVPDNMAGSRAKCKTCGQVVAVPTTIAASSASRIKITAPKLPVAAAPSTSSLDDVLDDLVGQAAQAKALAPSPAHYESAAAPAKSRRRTGPSISQRFLNGGFLAGCTSFGILALAWGFLATFRGMPTWLEGRLLVSASTVVTGLPPLVFLMLGATRAAKGWIAGGLPIGFIGIFLIAYGSWHEENVPVSVTAAGQPTDLYPEITTARITPLKVQLDPNGDRAGETYVKFHDELRAFIAVTIPKGAHAPRSLPCVIYCRDYSDLLTREYDPAKRDWSLPFQAVSLKNGFVSVRYVPEYRYDYTVGSNLPLGERKHAIQRYGEKQGGVADARGAVNVALTIPEVNPQQLYTVGRGADGLYALLLAAHDPRIRGCIVDDPIVSIEEHYGKERLAALSRDFVDTSTFAIRHSPLTHVKHYRCAMLFAGSPAKLSATATQQFITQLQTNGLSVQTVDSARVDSAASDWLVRMGAVRPAAAR